MKALSVLICGCWLAALPANASGVTGTVVAHDSGEALGYADVVLYRSADSVFVAGTVSGTDGRFVFTSVAAGNYYVECRFIGYSVTRSPAFRLGSQKPVDLGTLYMHPSSGHLDGVVVEGRRPAYVQHLDKRVFNVGTDLMSSSGSVSDLMRNIPSVTVDVDGKVSLRGSENVTILLDGKPSTLMSSRTRADVLRQMPAADIERIEVITNPSAAYNPDGVNGIINIVRKTQGKAGLSGGISANVGTGGRKNATASAGFKTDRVNLFASYGIRRDLYETDIHDRRIRNGNAIPYVMQQTAAVAHPLSNIVRAGADWNITRNDRLQLSGGFNSRGFARHDNIYTTETDANHNIGYQGRRCRDDDESVKQWEVATVYAHTFGRGHKLTVDYGYSSLEGLEDNRYSTFSTDGSSKDNTQIWQAYYRHLLRVGYRRRLGGRLKLSLGYELDALQTDLFYHAQSFYGSGFVADPNRTSDFTNHETCHSFYATLKYEQGRWGVLLGLRPEHMQIKSQLFTLDSIVNNAYFMVYPTLHTSYAVDGHNELRLSYSLRVNRPEADDLNPFPEYQNPLTLKAGNPYLKSEKVHSLEAAYQWKKGVTTILGVVYYRYVTNKLTTITRYVDGNVLMTTKENMDNSSAAGAEVMVGSEIGKWLTLNVNGNLFYDRIDATRLGYASHKGAMAWSASMNAALVPFGNALLQLNSRVLSTALTPQERREGSFSMDIGLKYEIPKLNISLNATLSDVFGTSHTTYTIDTPQLQQRVEQRNGSRVFYFGVAWNFETLKHKYR